MDDGLIDETALRARLAALTEEHRSLDAAVKALSANGVSDQLKLIRLKKRKLSLKDQIQWIEDQLNPDIIA